MLYNMVAYKLKLMPVEDDAITFFPIRYKDNSCSMEDEKIGDYSVTVIPDGGYFCGTGLPEKTVFRSNNINKIIYSVIIYFHIGVAKYRIY